MSVRYQPLFKYNKKITSFDGEYAYLSPDYPTEFTYKGETYHSIREAYNAAATSDKDIRTMGEIILRRFDWAANIEDRKKLASLEQAYITWNNKEHNNFWGNCCCFDCIDQNQNVYGRLLMEVRNWIISQDKLARRKGNSVLKKYEVLYF